MRIRVVAAGLAVLVLGACATIPPSRQDDKVVRLIDLFNTSPAEEFVEYAGVPFLFGDQVLYTENDLRAVLARVQEAGLVIVPVIVGSADAAAAPTGSRFDVGVFYDRLPEDARIILAQSNGGDVTLIVGGEAAGLPRLLGLVRGRP